MAVATTGGTAAVFELKNTTLPLLALQLKGTDLGALADELAGRLRDTPHLFDHDPLVIDLSALDVGDGEAAAPDFPALVTLLRAHRMQPVAVRGGTPDQMAAALAAGLPEAPEPPPSRPPREVEVVKEVLREVEVVREVPVAGPGTLVIDKPLRSGQQVYAKGGDLVVLAAVNFGAEVIADGHIHVYAPLRGKAIAGHRGNTEARIFSTCLEPELIAIAGVYRTTETALPANVLGKPAQVRLVDGTLVMAPLQTT